jgi:hypothetical protein
MHQLVLFLATLLAGDPSNATAAAPAEVWVGHQVLHGKRKIPLYGEKETHTENYFIAEVVHPSSSQIVFRQKLCHIDIRPIKGVTASMKPDTVARLPKSRFVFNVQPDGSLGATPWTNGWDVEDIDGDGAPGATVQISGSTCSGSVFVSNQSVTSLVSGHTTDDGMAGTISVHVKQKVLGANGFCLKLIAGDSDETQTGTFAFRRVEPGSTCRSFSPGTWPVKATEK